MIRLLFNFMAGMVAMSVVWGLIVVAFWCWIFFV